MEKSLYKFNCEKCLFHTNVRQNFTYHISSKRHNDTLENKSSFIFICNICSKKYKSANGLRTHVTKCKNEGDTKIIKTEMDEIKHLLYEIKVNKQSAAVNHTTNQPINVILNEKLPNAPNFIDMINKIQLLSVYPSTITSVEYVSTVVEMLKKAINKYPISERPIYCIKDEDENQKIIHIRHNNEWHKEKEIDWIIQIHNTSLGDDDAPTESEEKIIFTGIQKIELHILNKIGALYGPTVRRDYSYEVDHPPNKIRIIKYMLEYINIDRDTLMKIIDEL
jgi:hypothetical protein